MPGGSSGGSSAAVAADLCLAATGTDTGGSIRQPAAVTGTRRPEADLWPLLALGHRRLRLVAGSGRSHDQDGARRRHPAEAAWPAWIPRIPPAWICRCPITKSCWKAASRACKVGIPKEYRIDGAPPEIDALWDKGADWLKAQGAEIVEVSLPHTKYALPTYYIVAPAEASSNLARYDGVRFGYRAKGARDITDLYEKSRAEGFGAEVQRRILIGTYVLSAGYYDAYYSRAQKLRTLIKRDFDAGVREMRRAADARHAGPGLRAWATRPTIRWRCICNDVFTVTVNLAGLPGIVGAGRPDRRTACRWACS